MPPLPDAVQTGPDAEVVAQLGAAARPLPDPEDEAFGPVLDRWADRRVVMLGDATHGTAEFYRARSAVTQHLIARHGVRIVALEADWPDAAVLDRHVRGDGRTGAASFTPFERFPVWMWRNAEIARLVAWIRHWNEGRAAEDRVSIHGLDIYSLTASMRSVIAYLDAVDPDAAAVARLRYGCLDPWVDTPSRYAGAVSRGYASCEDAVVEQCREILERDIETAPGDTDALDDARQNARLVAAAEGYYRAMYRGGAQAWNLRDSHMFDTLSHVIEARGGAKAVVWAHNSHVGDARATGMGRHHGEHNIGQLAREAMGDAVALIGFGTHDGTVAAATDWGGPMEVKGIRPSHPGSYEALCHAVGEARFALEPGETPDLTEALREARLERFIGVIYRPETELASHYVDAVLPEQFDGWVWIDRTRALRPSGTAEPGGDGPPDTWPFGL